MDEITAFEAKERFLECFQQVIEKQQPLRVTSSQGNMILLSEETYQNILVTLEFLSTPGLLDQINFETVREAHHARDCVSL